MLRNTCPVRLFFASQKFIQQFDSFDVFFCRRTAGFPFMFFFGIPRKFQSKFGLTIVKNLSFLATPRDA